LDLEQEVNDLLMLGQPFLGRQLESAFHERHIKASLMRRAPGRAGAGRPGMNRKARTERKEKPMKPLIYANLR
jgi:hypothetical protein